MKEYIPKGSMCAVCENKKKDCSNLEWEKMQKMKIYPDGVIQVRCNVFVKHKD